MTWNTNRVDTLKTLWGEGRTASAIAAVLGGITRNAVIGKVHRLQLSSRATASRAPRIRKAPSSAPSGATRSRAGVITPGTTALPNLGPAPAVHPGVGELKASHCRWPEGDPKKPGFHFCGRTPLMKRPYCAHHFALSIAVARRTSALLQEV